MPSRQTIAALETAWRREPQAVFVRLGEALRDGGAPDRAISVLRDGLVRWPHQLAGWVALARAHRSTGQLTEARRALDEALNRDPDHWGANLLLAEGFRSDGARVDEVAVLRRLARIAPGQEGVARLLRVAEAAAGHRPAIPGPEPDRDDNTTRPLPVAGLEPSVPHAPFRVRTTPSATRPIAPERRGTVPAASRPVRPAAGGRTGGPLSGPGGARRPTPPPDPFLNETMAELLAAQGLSDAARHVLQTLADRDPTGDALSARIAELAALDVTTAPPLEPRSALADLLLAVATDLDALGSARRPSAPGEAP